MKQYTTNKQTAKLVEMGFKKPNGLEFLVREQDNPDNAQIVQRMAYSIGELISFLPKKIDYKGFQGELYILFNQEAWNVEYSDLLEELCSIYRSELIDAIFDMCVKLKEEGVI